MALKPTRRPLILWCDDSPDIRALASVEAANYSWDFFGTSHAVGALAEFKRSSPDAVVLDLVLPTFSPDVESGLDVCAEIRKLDPTVPIIIFTGVDQAISKPAGFASGANWTFIKTEAGLDDIFNKIEDIRRNAAPKQPQTPLANGQTGGSWFTNREMGQYAINLIALLIIVWLVARMDAQLSFLTRKVDTVEQNLNFEVGTRSASFNVLDGSIKETKGALGQINKGK